MNNEEKKPINEIDFHIPKKKGKKAQTPTTATSFDVDDFFSAAMNRGYGEKPKTDSDN